MSVRQAVSRSTRTVGQGQRPRVRPVVHWLPFPVALSVGAVLHWQLGQRGWWTVLAVSIFLALSAGLSVFTWEAAAPRGQLVRGQVTATVAVNLSIVAALLVFGVVRATFWPSLALSAFLSLSWMIRRTPAVHGEGKDDHGAATDNAFGLSITKAKTIASSPERATAEWTLGNGQTLEDVTPKLGSLGTELGTIRRGVRVTETDKEGVVRVHAIYRDVLRETKPWAGPSNPGGSIKDGIPWGDYEDCEVCTLYVAGNYEGNIAPAHVGITGMTRAGKGVCMHIVCAELSTKADVSPLIVLDERKGRQTTDNIDAAIGIYADTSTKIRAVVKGLNNAVAVRAQVLGQQGYKSWTPEAARDPRLRMGALFALLEEAATFAHACERDLVEIAEAGLSAGVFLFVSAQLWKHDRIPTSLRSQIGSNVIAYGLGSTEDASFLLSDATIAGGNDPGQWGTRYPGRYACELNGVPTERFSIPCKGYLAEDEQLQEVTDEWGPKMLPYDKWTLDALGTAYTPYVPRRPGAPGYVAPSAPASGGAAEVEAPVKDELTQVRERMIQMQDEDNDRAYEEDTRPAPEEEDGLYGVPEVEDEELGAQMAAVDLEAPLPEWTGGEVDLSPKPTPGARQWTRAEKEQAFRSMLLRLAGEPGGMERTYETGDLFDRWVAELGCEAEALKAWRLHELLNAAEDAGEMERLKRGHWRIITLAKGDAT